MNFRSIYDGDPQFVNENGKKFQYKFGEDGTSKSFILEISFFKLFTRWDGNCSNDVHCHSNELKSNTVHLFNLLD